MYNVVDFCYANQFQVCELIYKSLLNKIKAHHPPGKLLKNYIKFTQFAVNGLRHSCSLVPLRYALMNSLAHCVLSESTLVII